jgi:hypothetical protein
VDDGGGAPDPRSYRDGFCRAVLRAGTALHAQVPVEYPGFPMRNREHTVGANLPAHAASLACRFVQAKGSDVVDITETFHPDSFLFVCQPRNAPPTQTINATDVEAI